MLRTQSFLPRALANWMAQVAASVGAALVVTAIYAALPRPAPVEASRPELTSGGKFAARAAAPVAYDGLDVMPLPQVTPLVATVTSDRLSAIGAPVGTSAVHHGVWDGPATLVLAPDRAAHAARPGRTPARVDIRRAVPAERHPVVAAEPGTVLASADAPDHEDGLIHSLPKVLPRLVPATLSGLREAWTTTASVGGALVAHVVPQIP